MYGKDYTKPIKRLSGHHGSVNVVFAVPGTHLCLSGGDDGMVRLWDLPSGTCLRTYHEHSGAVRSLAITSGQKYILSGGNDAIFRLWGLDNGKFIREFKGHRGAVTSIALTPDGKYIVSGSEDCDLRLWNLSTGECVRKYAAHPLVRHGEIQGMIKSTNWEFAYSDYNTDLRHGKTYDGKNQQFFGHVQGVNCLVISRSGKYIVSGSDDNTLRLWDLFSGKCIWIYGGHSWNPGFAVTKIALPPWGRQMITCCRDIHFWKYNSRRFRRKLWNVLGEKPQKKIEFKNNSATFAVDEKAKHMVVADGWENKLLLFSLRNNRIVRKFSGHEGKINDIAFNDAHDLAISCGREGDVCLWKING